jgi:branched-chain amino acid transport system substrate-binding protein
MKALLTAAAVMLSSVAAHADIVIAVGAPITGNYASFGDQLRRGAEAAVADLNAKGGVLGQKVQLIVGDDACDPKQAVSVANSFVNRKAVFVVGHYCSGSSIPASDIYAEAGIVQITPASTNPTLTERKLKTVFRVCGRDDQQGLIAGRYVFENYKGKRVAFVHDKTAYGKGLADESRKAFNALGGKEILYEAITAGERDYSALVTRLKNERVDVLYYGGYHTESGQIARQMRLAGLEAQLISGDATVTQEFWQIAGQQGQGTLMTFTPDPRALPAAKPLVDRFRKESFEPEGYTLFTYAAVQAWALATETAKSTDGTKVATALHAGSFDTAVGTIAFDEKGDPKGNQYIFYVWKDGTYKPL